MFESFVLGIAMMAVVLWLVLVGTVLVFGPVFGPLFGVASCASGFILFERYRGRYRR